MHVPSTLQTDVRDLLFADWAELVTFLEVSTTYDPAAGETAESIAETDLLAILGPVLNEPEPNTAHQHRQSQRVFLIRAEDVPENASFAASRIRCQGREYAILTVDHAPQTNLLVCHTSVRD